MGVEVHAAVPVVPRAGEAHERLAELAGGLDGEGARGGDAGHQRDPGHAGLLDDLEAGPGGDQQEAVPQRQAVLEQGPADHLVDRVVPAHVLADNEQVPFEVHERGGMDAAGAGEDGLLVGELAGGAEDHVRVRHPGLQQRVAALLPDGVDALRTAHPAGGGGGEGARDLGQQLRPGGREVHDVVGVLGEAAAGVDHGAVAVAGLGHVLAVTDQALRVQEAVDQLDVVAGGAHGEGELLPVQADVQRLLDGDMVALASGVELPVPHPDGADPRAVGDPAHPSRIALPPAVGCALSLGRRPRIPTRRCRSDRSPQGAWRGRAPAASRGGSPRSCAAAPPRPGPASRSLARAR